MFLCVHPVMVWLVEHCAEEARHRGGWSHTEVERKEGRSWGTYILEFGSPVMFRVSEKVHGGVMQERWFPGIWLGEQLHTEEHLVMKRENSHNLAMKEGQRQAQYPSHDRHGEDSDDEHGAVRGTRPGERTDVTSAATSQGGEKRHRDVRTNCGVHEVQSHHPGRQRK